MSDRFKQIQAGAMEEYGDGATAEHYEGFYDGAKWADANPSCGFHKKCEKLEARIVKLEYLVSLAASFLAEEDITHYSTAMTFKQKHTELSEDEKE